MAERSVYYLFRDTPERRAAVAGRGAADNQALYGMRELAARGWRTASNLEAAARPGPFARQTGRLCNRLCRAAGLRGGDFASLLGGWRRIQEASVVFATVDSVGLPLITLRRVLGLRPAAVYASIGLLERLAEHPPATAARYRRLFGSVTRVLAYGWEEAERLAAWLAPVGTKVEFVPYGVDTSVWQPREAAIDTDIVSVGADPQRDFALLAAMAQRRPEWTFRVVAAPLHASVLNRVPPNVQVEWNLPAEEVRRRLAAAAVVLLPVRENSYSGATTTLLQAMSMGKAVVVSRTGAIRDGYGLADGVHVRWAAPGRLESHEAAIAGLLAEPGLRAELGASACRHVRKTLSWDRYVDRIERGLGAAAGVEAVP